MDQTATPDHAPQEVAMSLEQALNFARRLHDSGQPQQAESIYGKILEAQPDNPQALCLKGLAAAQTGRPQEGVELISKAVALSPAEPGYRNHLGQVFMQQGQHQLALEQFNTSVKLDPEAPWSRNSLGAVLFWSGQIDAAEPHFQKAVELEPSYADAHTFLGYIAMERGQRDEAAACFRRALASNPHFQAAYDNLRTLLKPEFEPRIQASLESWRAEPLAGFAAGKRPKPGLLFVGQRWIDGRPQAGESNLIHNFWGSLETCGLADQHRLNYDEFYLEHQEPADARLIELCAEKRPDLIFLEYLNGSPANPSLETLDIIANQMNIPIVGAFADMLWQQHIENAELLAPYVKFHVVLDTAAFYERVEDVGKYLYLWPPQDPRYFHDPGLERDIPISFFGRVGKTGRREGIEALRQAGIEVHQAGGQREAMIPMADYAEGYQRSRIALNFSSSPSGFPQLCGRVLEACLCGAMLLEEDNPETAGFLEPGKDYVPWSSHQDLVEKARYYLEHDGQRREIAERGSRRVRQYYNAEVFWKTVFGHAFGIWEY